MSGVAMWPVREPKVGRRVHVSFYIDTLPGTIRQVTGFDALIEFDHGKWERVSLSRLYRNVMGGEPDDGEPYAVAS